MCMRFVTKAVLYNIAMLLKMCMCFVTKAVLFNIAALLKMCLSGVLLFNHILIINTITITNTG